MTLIQLSYIKSYKGYILQIGDFMKWVNLNISIYYLLSFFFFSKLSNLITKRFFSVLTIKYQFLSLMKWNVIWRYYQELLLHNSIHSWKHSYVLLIIFFWSKSITTFHAIIIIHCLQILLLLARHQFENCFWRDHYFIWSMLLLEFIIVNWQQ